MLIGSKTPLRAHPNLLLLQKALRAAESGTPAQPPRHDANEQCAEQLIAQLQAPYKKLNLFLNLPEIPSPHGAPLNLTVVATLQTH